MPTKKRPKRATEAAKPEEKIRSELERAKAQAEAALSRVNDEEKARRQAEAALADTQKALTAAQSAAENEGRAREEIEQVLADVRKELAAAQAEAKQEHQARARAEQARAKVERALAEAEKVVGVEATHKEQSPTVPGEGSGEQRVSFVVRVTVDEQGQPRRTEIEHAQSKEKKSYSTLDAKELSAFILAHLSPPVMPEPAPSPVPPAIVEAPRPESVEPAASLTISDVQVFSIRVSGVSVLMLNLNESFVVQTSFKLEGPEALSLTTQESAYQVQIHAHDVTRGSTTSLTAYQRNLVKDTIDYTTQAHAPGLPSGIYRLVTLITVQAPTKLVGHHEGPVFQVGEVQQPVASVGSQEVVQPQ